LPIGAVLMEHYFQQSFLPSKLYMDDGRIFTCIPGVYDNKGPRRHVSTKNFMNLKMLCSLILCRR